MFGCGADEVSTRRLVADEAAPDAADEADDWRLEMADDALAAIEEVAAARLD